MRSHENFELNKSYLNYLYCQFQYTILVWSFIGYNLFNLYNYPMCTVHILYCMMYVLDSLSAYLWFLNSVEHFTMKYFLRCKTSGRLKSSSDDRLCACCLLFCYLWWHHHCHQSSLQPTPSTLVKTQLSLDISARSLCPDIVPMTAAGANTGWWPQLSMHSSLMCSPGTRAQSFECRRLAA